MYERNLGVSFDVNNKSYAGMKGDCCCNEEGGGTRLHCRQ